MVDSMNEIGEREREQKSLPSGFGPSDGRVRGVHRVVGIEVAHVLGALVVVEEQAAAGRHRLGHRHVGQRVGHLVVRRQQAHVVEIGRCAACAHLRISSNSSSVGDGSSGRRGDYRRRGDYARFGDHELVLLAHFVMGRVCHR